MVHFPPFTKFWENQKLLYNPDNKETHKQSNFLGGGNNPGAAETKKKLKEKTKCEMQSVPRISNILRCLLPTAATNNLGSFGSHVSEVTVSDTPSI